MVALALFSADLDDPSLSDCRFAASLDAAEQLRAGQFARDDLARRFVAGRAVMRHVLGRMLGRRPADVTITCNAWGKPEVDGGPFFNLSHTGRAALFAVDELAPIGVDIEVDDPAAEQEWFDAVLSAQERVEFDAGRFAVPALLRLWVRKEAVVKAIGCGFSLAADALDIGLRAVDVHNWRPVEIGVTGLSSPLVLLDLPGQEIAALARMGGAPATVVRTAFVP
jgi:4'-phosphopantetheinyl transferase